MTPLRAIQLGLWTLAALLFVATLWPFVAGIGADDNGAGAQRRAARPFLVPSAADLALPPLESFSETLNRPLFTATRRPPSPLAVLQGQQAPPPAPEKTGPRGEKLVIGTYLLNGIVIDGARKLMLLKHVTSGKTLRVAEGETLDDWLVQSVTQDQVVLKRGDREDRVALHERR